jgi:hypothetical protein
MATNKQRSNRDRPNATEFRIAVRELGGNLTKVAERFGVNRCTIYKWRDDDPEFMSAIRDERLRLFDESMATSRVVALGVPKYDYEYDANGEPMLDDYGRPIKRMVGWNVPPDPNMLRFFLTTYGKYDKIGYDDEDTGVPAAKEGVDIRNWIELRNEGKK